MKHLVAGCDDRIPGPCLISSSADADNSGPEPVFDVNDSLDMDLQITVVFGSL